MFIIVFKNIYKFISRKGREKKKKRVDQFFLNFNSQVMLPFQNIYSIFQCILFCILIKFASNAIIFSNIYVKRISVYCVSSSVSSHVLQQRATICNTRVSHRSLYNRCERNYMKFIAQFCRD